jgi:hypothetical protein
MDYRFNAEEWNRLTPEHRARRCRLMADEAMKLADSAPSTLAGSYLTIAQSWLKLADEIDRNSN